MKPIMTAGKTKQLAWVKISPIKALLLRPINRITPISNVFVSTEIIKSEYISKTAIPINITRSTSKMRPINIISILVTFSMLPSRLNFVVRG